jgi:hypothetical protein
MSRDITVAKGGSALTGKDLVAAAVELAPGGGDYGRAGARFGRPVALGFAAGAGPASQPGAGGVSRVPAQRRCIRPNKAGFGRYDSKALNFHALR